MWIQNEILSCFCMTKGLGVEGGRQLEKRSAPEWAAPCVGRDRDLKTKHKKFHPLGFSRIGGKRGVAGAAASGPTQEKCCYHDNKRYQTPRYR